jgi:hypothetical protein
VYKIVKDPLYDTAFAIAGCDPRAHYLERTDAHVTPFRYVRYLSCTYVYLNTFSTMHLDDKALFDSHAVGKELDNDNWNTKSLEFIQDKYSGHPLRYILAQMVVLAWHIPTKDAELIRTAFKNALEDMKNDGV